MINIQIRSVLFSLYSKGKLTPPPCGHNFLRIKNKQILLEGQPWPICAKLCQEDFNVVSFAIGLPWQLEISTGLNSLNKSEKRSAKDHSCEVS